MRADLFLVENGFATTRSQAQRLITSGAQWRVMVDTEVDAPWKRVAKHGDEVPDNAELEVLDNTEAKYISRGGLKLEGALMATNADVNGLRCLDIGQSTGGFTDCLLQHGAAEVVGIDVGHGQLHATMRDDVRVVCIEGVNARALTADDLAEHYRRAVHLKNGGEDGDDEYGHEDEVDSDGARVLIALGEGHSLKATPVLCQAPVVEIRDNPWRCVRAKSLSCAMATKGIAVSAVKVDKIRIELFHSVHYPFCPLGAVLNGEVTVILQVPIRNAL